MGDVKAFDGELAVSAAGSAYTVVGGMTDASLSNSRGKIDVTDWDSAGWKESLPGFGELSLSFTHNYDEAEAGQSIIRTAAQTGAQLYFRYRPAGDLTGVGKETIFLANLDSYDDGGGGEDKVSSSGSASSSGAPTFQTQP